MKLFEQNSFLGGLNTQFDPTKLPAACYPLGVNIRVRQNVVSPTRKHVRIAFPFGNLQGIYAAGSLVVVFISGLAYYADITVSPIEFFPISGWTLMDSTVPRIYAELIPATTNRMQREGSLSDIGLPPANLVTETFDGTIASTPQSLIVFDGTDANRPQQIFPDGTVSVLNDFADWQLDDKEYVPAGLLPAVLNAKLFLVSTDRKRIYHSVSGRCVDFVVNIAADGSKGGDAETVATAVAFNAITGIRPLSTGQLLVSTLFATYALDLDYDLPFFGEPSLTPIGPLIPAGAVNDISFVDILQDTAFITQSGIHAFNAVAQAQKESNNFPLGAPIRGLFIDPDNPSSVIIQEDTAATSYSDFAFFAVNTIYGYGCVVYDTIDQMFQSLDLSFGRVKQFASTKLSGSERLFFITHDNEIFEAFAGEETETARIYLGEFTVVDADSDLLVDHVDMVFGNVRTSGYAKLTVFVDKQKLEEQIIEVSVDEFENNLPIPVPYVSNRRDKSVEFKLTNKVKGWRLGLLIEWNFNGDLTNVLVDGTKETAENIELQPQFGAANEVFGFIGNTGFGEELNPGGDFPPEEVLCIEVVKGQRYIFNPGANGPLVQGNEKYSALSIFTALGDRVSIAGTGSADFSLKNAENLVSLLAAMRADNVRTIIGGGDHSYEDGTQIEVNMGLLPFERFTLETLAGDREYNTSLGGPFWAKLGIPRFRVERELSAYIDFFFYNGGWTEANVPVDASGITIGATSEPQGNDSSSLQFAWLKNELARSTKPFKIVIVHEPPYTTAASWYPGYAALRLPLKAVGASAILSAHSTAMERFVVNAFPYFVCGTGGVALDTFEPNTAGIASFRASVLGYLKITADPISCNLEFKSLAGDVLDSYALYA